MDMTKVDFTNSYDEKIMNWDKKDFNELVGSMTDEEIEGMANELDAPFSHYGPAYWMTSNGYDEYSIVAFYIQNWLFNQIEMGVISGTKELFEIVMAI